jgi:hypothetical protein
MLISVFQVLLFKIGNVILNISIFDQYSDNVYHLRKIKQKSYIVKFLIYSER